MHGSAIRDCLIKGNVSRETAMAFSGVEFLLADWRGFGYIMEAVNELRLFIRE